MRTGSIGNRDAESMISTLVEPKKTILGSLRKELLLLGFSEEASYDAINVESFIAYSVLGIQRFILRHKWTLSVTLIITGKDELDRLCNIVSGLRGKRFEKNLDDDTLWVELKPQEDKDLILQTARSFL